MSVVKRRRKIVSEQQDRRNRLYEMSRVGGFQRQAAGCRQMASVSDKVDMIFSPKTLFPLRNADGSTKTENRMSHP